MSNPPNNNQEIDLIYLFKKIKAFFKSIGYSIYTFFNFLYAKKIIILSIAFMSVVIGYGIDRMNSKKLKTELIVTPNFQSIDYLYSEVDNFKSNNNEGIFKDLISIKVEPIEDFYGFMQDKDNLETFKIMAENGINKNKIINDKSLSKNYKNHVITITTKDGKNTEKIVSNVMKVLNQKKYYADRQKVERANLIESRKQSLISINQINQILNQIGTGNLQQTSNDISINSYDKLSDLLNAKTHYLKEIKKIDVKLIETQYIIYTIDQSNNLKDIPPLYLRFMFLLPIASVIIFLLFSMFSVFMKSFNPLSDSTK